MKKFIFYTLFMLLQLIQATASDIIITFDPPSLPGGSKALQSYTENGMVFSGKLDRPFSHNDAGLSNRPNNGTAALNVTRYYTRFNPISPVLFDLLQVDLAEYSTIYAYPQTITFTGHKSDSSTVAATFVTDGIMDGIEPLADFETFTFDTSFRNLIYVEMSANFTIDNMHIRIPSEPFVAPIANTGEDQIVYAFYDGMALVTLDGSDSNDPDGKELTYKWTWTIDSNVVCEVNGVNPTIELPVGLHNIQLVVNNGTMDSVPDDVNITVIAPMECDVKITPQTINRKSEQPNIHACLELPAGLDANAVDVNEPFILYPAGIEATKQQFVSIITGDQNVTGVMLFFDKAQLMENILADGLTELSVEGRLTSGQYFYGSDTVRIKE